MSIMSTVFPDKVQFQGTKIDVHKGEDYTPVLNQQLHYIRIKERMYTKKHTDIATIEAGFDIETTSTDKGAFMYKWQMVFGEFLISGRTWEEWCVVMEAIQRAYQFGTTVEGKGKKRHTFVKTFILWIANQGYEFQFFCRRKWNGAPLIQQDSKGNADVFADSMRRPLKTMLSFTGTENNSAITVYDALKFSTSLDQLAKDYGITKKKKKKMPDGSVVSDLDYSVKRNTQTPLNDEEEEYCDADVEILYEWAHYYNSAYVIQNQICPMTSTGIIRYAVTESYDEFATKADYNATLSMHPSFGEYYRIIRFLYRGGFTYGHRAKAGKNIADVVGKDFTSSYPACLLQSDEFPITAFSSRSISSVDELDKYSNKAWYADFEFTNIIQTRGISVENVFKLHEYKTSASQCRSETGCVLDNGKIAFAKKITVTLTSLDFECYKKFYKWSDVKVTKLMVAEKGKIPAWLSRVIKHYYKLKSSLKAAGKGGTTEYALSKAVVNGIYGLLIQRLVHDEIRFDPDAAEIWGSSRLHFDREEERMRMQDEYETAIGRDKRTIMLNGGKPKVVTNPYWGIYTTSIARKRLLDAIYELGDDFVYCDTDSVYYTNEEAHTEYFEKWNADTYAFNDTNLIEQEFHTLGDFDPVELNDGDGIVKYNFKTLGAKRYIKWSGSNIHATVAGLPHGALERKARGELKLDPHKKLTEEEATQVVNWIVDNFEAGMEIAAEYAFKNAHTYIDEPVTDLITDPYGNQEYMHEESCMTIFPIDFTMKIPDDYKKIMGVSVWEFMLYECYKRLYAKNERLS